MAAADPWAPGTDESGGGCQVDYKRVKTSQRNPEDRQAGKFYFSQVAFPGVSLSVNPKHYETLQERKFLNIFRDILNSNSEGIHRDSNIFKLSLGQTEFREEGLQTFKQKGFSDILEYQVVFNVPQKEYRLAYNLIRCLILKLVLGKNSEYGFITISR